MVEDGVFSFFFSARSPCRLHWLASSDLCSWLEMECLSAGSHSEDCIGLPRIASGRYFLQEQRHDEAWFRLIGRCNSWSRISRMQEQQGRKRQEFLKEEGREATPETALVCLGGPLPVI